MSAGFEIANVVSSLANSEDVAPEATQQTVQSFTTDSATFKHDHDSSLTEAQRKYAIEKSKRDRADGLGQYDILAKSEKLAHFSADPWIESDKREYGRSPPALVNGGTTEVLILGAGFGGILTAVRLVQAGISPGDICIIDSAGGFGGTWYWNRYPGLMCDVESYLYLPLLEEMQYIPKHKYSYGYEIREYINMIVDKYDLRSRSMLETTVKGMSWDDEQKCWDVRMQSGDEYVEVTSRFVFLAGGLLNTPKVPNGVRIEDFGGSMFHTSRWDYPITGGSPKAPSMDKLKDKIVGVLGTGATAIQVIPQLARWAKKLYVIQRTPTSVDWRGQHETDTLQFSREVATEKGWQRKRNANFSARLSDWPNVPELDLVGDSWTSMPSYKAIIGGPNPISTPDTIPSYVASLNELDYARQKRVRERVSSIVKDKDTAEKLKAWYPGFCKRPSFHDDYLPSFNLPNVELLDTDGKGIDFFNERGAVVLGKEYPLDVLVLGTGYLVNAETALTGLPMQGRGGKTIATKYEQGWGTLHGIISRGFPNAFSFVPLQGAAGANFTFVLDQFAIHSAHIVAQARRQASSADPSKVKKVTIEPTEEAEESWALQCMMRAGALAAISGCTPSYINAEGSRNRLSDEEKMKSARAAPWGEGLESYLKVVEEWRAAGDMKGLDISW